MSLEDVLEKLSQGEITVTEAKAVLQTRHLLEIKSHTRFDANRELVSGTPEIVYCKHKSSKQIEEIVEHVLATKQKLLLTKLQPEHQELVQQLKQKFGARSDRGEHVSTLLLWKNKEPVASNEIPVVGILTGGTSDLPIATEVELTLTLHGVPHRLVNDVGVAGMHRLFDPLSDILDQKPSCLIIIAGMEGALPTVVAGLVDIPIIGVPTATGYGLGGDGTAALLSMLQSCSPGISVVNIDGGVQAATFAALLSKRIAQEKESS